MSHFWRQTAVIANRDFMAIAATPAFLLFLLAPLFMFAMGAIGGGGAAHLAMNGADKARLAAIAGPRDAALLLDADKRLRAIASREAGLPRLDIVPSHGQSDAKLAEALMARTDLDYNAVIYGPVSAPTIIAERESLADYMAAVSDQARRDSLAGPLLQSAPQKPKILIKRPEKGGVQVQQGVGVTTVFMLFFLTLLLAGQTVGTFAEEKSNKVIEILAAAAPLEAVFFGKLLGMFGVALLFVGFWGGVGAIGMTALAASPLAAKLPVISVAMGLPTFLGLALLYFTMAFFLLGAVFLSVGAQASSMREIQMLSLPITFFQIGMFALASAAASQPGSTLALVAQIFPFSSPFAMAARAATDSSLWPHLLALSWQMAWLVLTIRLGSALFRRGVLKSGPPFWAIFARKTA